MTSETASEHWYALKVFYNKVFEIEAYLKDKAFESYIPLKTVEMMWRGEKKICRKPAVSSLMFVRATEHAAIGLQRQLNNRIIVYCDRDTKRPAAIPEREMNIFRLVTSSGDRELEYFGGEDTVYHTGDRVRVTEGIFKGAEGYIRRIKGNRRLVVSIEGIVAVATSYIQGFRKRSNAGSPSESFDMSEYDGKSILMKPLGARIAGSGGVVLSADFIMYRKYSL